MILEAAEGKAKVVLVASSRKSWKGSLLVRAGLVRYGACDHLHLGGYASRNRGNGIDLLDL